MTPKQKLELTWIGKDTRPRLEPRILLEDPEKSYSAPRRIFNTPPRHPERSEGPLEDSSAAPQNDKGVMPQTVPTFDNKLIFGDNLLALKALEQEYYGKVKCIFIDPPYNTGSAFEHYDDGVEHSIWLGLMQNRLLLLKNLLANDGSLWITIDDNEAHYLKVMCDEIFGRGNFVGNVVWQKRTSPDIRATLGSGHDHILVYAKDLLTFKKTLKPLPKTEKQKSTYKNPDNDPRGAWVSSDYTAQGFRPNQMYSITTSNGVVYDPPEGRCWKNIEPVFLKLVEEGRIWFGKDGKGVPRRKTYLSESEQSMTWTWWPNSEVGHTQEAKKEINALFGAANAFDTPKPERLIQRVLQLATDDNDLVLDSFAGSGTTGAVAHKMGRRWIMVELGEHCHTHVIPRLKKVIDGTDQGGISQAVGWAGGGGFRYYRLAPSLLEKDKWDRLVISRAYNPAMLSEAMCKLMGFTYKPSEDFYWIHGQSTETDYIYVTTQTLDEEQLQTLSDDVGRSRTLLVCCAAFRGQEELYPNLTLKKIPQSVLKACEWGKDDYSLNTGASFEETSELNQGPSHG